MPFTRACLTTEWRLGSGRIQDNIEWQRDWVRSVVLAATEDLGNHRELMKRHVRALHSWPSIAREWLPILTKGAAPGDYAIGAVIETRPDGIASVHFEM
jgi:hypothetical protein